MITAALAILQTDEQRNILSDFYQTYKNRFFLLPFQNYMIEILPRTLFRKRFPELHLNQKRFFLSAITKCSHIQML